MKVLFCPQNQCFLSIARAPDKTRCVPARLDARGRPRSLRRRPKLRKPSGARPAALECRTGDLVERLRDGLRRSIVSFVDPASRLAFAWAVPTKHARHTRRALDRTLSLFPKPPDVVLSDNGREFEAGFAEALGERGIRRWYTDPKTPKMNAHAERLGRTLQESFVDDHEELLFTALLCSTRNRPTGGFPQHRAPPSSTRSQNTPILPSSPPTRVPKVVDLYRELTRAFH